MGVGDDDEPPRSTRKCCLPQTKQNKLRPRSQANDSINQIAIKSHRGRHTASGRGDPIGKSWNASHGEGVVDAKPCWKRLVGYYSIHFMVLYYIILFSSFLFDSILLFLILIYLVTHLFLKNQVESIPWLVLNC